MNIYKLKYTNKKTAIADLKAKKVLLDNGFGIGVQAIVEIGKICLTQSTEETEAIFADGYHYDIMCEQDIDFIENSIIVNNPKHKFLGYE